MRKNWIMAAGLGLLFPLLGIPQATVFAAPENAAVSQNASAEYIASGFFRTLCRTARSKAKLNACLDKFCQYLRVLSDNAIEQLLPLLLEESRHCGRHDRYLVLIHL